MVLLILNNQSTPWFNYCDQRSLRF